MKVAIVCDFIAQIGGSERMLSELHKLFPKAPIYTSTIDETARKTFFKSAEIHTAWFQKLPKPLRRHQLLTIPRQFHFSHLKLKGFDIVISLGSAESKAVKVVAGKHINICYTPTLYYWVKPENYLNKESSDSINFLWRFGLRVLLPLMRRWDLKASKNPDVMLAISSTVQKRIKKYYSRESAIIYPPVDTGKFINDGRLERSGYVVLGRQVSHKRFDLAIKACNEVQKKLVVLGKGPEHERLVLMAGPTVEFKTNVSDVDVKNFISKAEALIFPNEEDFGIVAVEAQAAGTPVIAYRAGGALDTVTEGITGEFFDSQNVESISKTLKNFNYRLYNRQSLVANAERFSVKEFEKSINNIVVKLYH